MNLLTKTLYCLVHTGFSDHLQIFFACNVEFNFKHHTLGQSKIFEVLLVTEITSYQLRTF